MKGLLLFACLTLGRVTLVAQTTLLEGTNNISITTLEGIAAPYFKSVPYGKSFSSFLQDFLNDPDLQQKVFDRRTDSSLFFASGTYKRHNPFIYRPTTLKLTIAESELAYNDSTHYRDTVLSCHLLVTTDTTSRAEGFVKKEYNRLLRKTANRFTQSTFELDKENGLAKGAATNCFIAPYAVSPLTIAWGRKEATREYVFYISLFFKVKGNKAEMITLPNESIETSQ
jgi:hypothetical protein